MGRRRGETRGYPGLGRTTCVGHERVMWGRRGPIHREARDVSAEPHIVYDPPYGGQAIRAKTAREAFTRVAAFLRAFTDADPDVPHGCDLWIHEPGATEEADWYPPAVRDAEARFGPGQRHRWAHGTSELHRIEWRLDGAPLAPTLDFLDGAAAGVRTIHGPVTVTASYRFRWIDPDTRVPLPGQEPERRARPTQATSTLLLSLERRPSAILGARFPFSAPDAAASAYVRRVIAAAPVPMASGRFRHWVPTVKPTDLGYAIRRIDAPWLDEA